MVKGKKNKSEQPPRNGSLSNLIGDAMDNSRDIPGSPDNVKKFKKGLDPLKKGFMSGFMSSKKEKSESKKNDDNEKKESVIPNLNDNSESSGVSITGDSPEGKGDRKRSKGLDVDDLLRGVDRKSFADMGKIFGGIDRDSFADFNTSFLNMFSGDGSVRTDWEEGLAVIESILLPDSEAAKALSESQVGGLRKVQQILLGGKNIDNSLHIPKGLLSDPAEPGSTSDFILRQYAGIKRTPPVKQRVLNVINANRFIKHLKTRRASFRALITESREAYVPSEWIRLEKQHQVELAELLCWENLSNWKFDIFKLNECANGQPLLFVGWAIMCSPYSQWVMQQSLKTEEEVANEPTVPPDEMSGYSFPQKYNTTQEILVNFLRSTEKEYVKENPYHNNIHAADVLQTLHTILYGMKASTFATAELEIFSLLIAAIVHDMGHPGKNNAFQINSESDLAIEYNDVSVLENMHVSRAFSKLMGKNLDPTINLFKGFSNEQRNASRKMIIEAVLDTDMTKHFSTVNKIKGIKLSHKDLVGLNEDDSWQILHYCLHIADISNQAKPCESAVRWTDRCLEEFFLQGDEEKKLGLQVSPLCDRMTTQRANSQIGFIKFVVQPAFELMAKILPAFDEQVLPLLDENLQYWKDQHASAMVCEEDDEKEEGGQTKEASKEEEAMEES